MTLEVGIRDLKSHLSEYLSSVEQGETLNVTKRGREIARVVPVNRGRSQNGLQKLIDEGLVVGDGRIRDLPTPVKLAGKGKSLSDYIIEEREKYR